MRINLCQNFSRCWRTVTTVADRDCVRPHCGQREVSQAEVPVYGGGISVCSFLREPPLTAVTFGERGVDPADVVVVAVLPASLKQLLLPIMLPVVIVVTLFLPPTKILGVLYVEAASVTFPDQERMSGQPGPLIILSNICPFKERNHTTNEYSECDLIIKEGLGDREIDTNDNIKVQHISLSVEVTEIQSIFWYGQNNKRYRDSSMDTQHCPLLAHRWSNRNKS